MTNSNIDKQEVEQVNLNCLTFHVHRGKNGGLLHARLLCKTSWALNELTALTNYSWDLNTGQVWYSNGRKLSDR